MAEHFDLSKYIMDLEKLVNIDSGSTDLSGCKEIVETFGARLKEIGLNVDIGDEEEKNPYVEGRYMPRGGSEIDVMFMGHLDTVFPKGTVSERPFTIKDQKAFGPGVADMKDGALLALYLAEGIIKEKMDVNLCLAFNSDEETGSAGSKTWMKEVGSRAKYCFNFEPGRESGAFVKQRKGVLDYKVRFKGIPAHAGVDPENGASAVVEMARWIEGLAHLQDTSKGTTLNAGLVQGGSASNVVAEHGEMVLDLRYTDDQERRRIEEAFDHMAEVPAVKGVKTSWESGDGFPPMNPNQGTEELICLMENAACKIGQPKPEFIATGGSSDANALAGIGLSVIDGCGPIGGFYHSDKEYMRLDTVVERYSLILQTVKSIAGR